MPCPRSVHGKQSLDLRKMAFCAYLRHISLYCVPVPDELYSAGIPSSGIPLLFFTLLKS